MSNYFNSLSRKVSTLVLVCILLTTSGISWLSYLSLKSAELGHLDMVHKTVQQALEIHKDEVSRIIKKGEAGTLDLVKDKDLVAVQDILTTMMSAPYAANVVFFYPDVVDIPKEDGSTGRGMRFIAVSESLAGYELTAQSDFELTDIYADAIEETKVAGPGFVVQTAPYNDGEGDWVSTMTQFNDSEGNYIADIGIDFSVEEINAKMNKYMWQSIIITSLTTIICAIIVWYIVQQQLSPLKKVRESIAKTASGDFTHKMNISNRRDEFGELSTEFDKMLDAVRELIENIKASVGTTLSSSQVVKEGADSNMKQAQNIYENVSNITNVTRNQHRSTEETMIALSEMAIGVQRIAEANANLSERIANVTSKTEDSRELMSDTVKVIESVDVSVTSLAEVLEELSNDSDKINHIVDEISKISGQTNILSLNASIEAARAGEHGRGFAVVANEVRSLAAQSKDSSERIAIILSTIVNRIKAVTESIEDARGGVSAAVSSINNANDNIEVVTEESVQVNSEVQEVSAATEEMSASSEEMLASMETLAATAKEIEEMTQGIAASIDEQFKSSAEASKHSEELLNNSEVVANEVGKFTV